MHKLPFLEQYHETRKHYVRRIFSQKYYERTYGEGLLSGQINSTVKVLSQTAQRTVLCLQMNFS